MKKERIITKFSVGYFTNGICVVKRVIVEGVLSGVVTKTYYPDLYEKGDYVEALEYLNKNDNIPHYVKILNPFTRFFKKIKNYSSYKTYNIIDFIHEIYDLPSCAWNYKKVIEISNRSVIIEKYNNKSIVNNYIKLNPEIELELIKIICNKHKSKKILNEFYVAPQKKIINRNSVLYSNNCPISIESIHNRKIFFDFKTYDILDYLFQSMVDNMSSKNKNLQILNDEFKQKEIN